MYPLRKSRYLTHPKLDRQWCAILSLLWALFVGHGQLAAAPPAQLKWAGPSLEMAKPVADQTPRKGAPLPRYLMTKLNVSDLARSVDFYTRVIGLKEMRRVERAVHVEVLLTPGGSDFESTLILVKEAAKAGPINIGDGYSMLALIVPDVRAVAKRLTKAGFEAERPITQIDSPFPYASKVSILFVKDPDGYLLEFLQFDGE